jgi:hypothetical protein
MRTDGKAEVQHYVPQVLLRLHITDVLAKRGSEQVWCFDKKTGRVFSPNIRGVLAGSRFYEVEIGGERISLEEELTRIEDQVGPIIAQLVRDRRLANLRARERQIVADFCAVQLIRTQAFREQIKDMNEGMAEALRKRGIDPSKVSNFEILSDEQIKAFSLSMLPEAQAVYSPHFLAKYWHLTETTTEDPFYLGDHPLVLDNDFADPGRGVGLASPGVSIYLPLCPTLCLTMTDPRVVSTLFAEAREVEARFKKLKRRMPRRGLTATDMCVLRTMEETRNRVKEHVEPLKKGTPSPYNPDVVMRVNSLQMIYAGRWIVSSRNDFSLPLSMIGDDPAFRGRRKLEVM